MALIVHLVNGEICLLLDEMHTTASALASRYPFGDLYVRYLEPQGLQWRVLQRGTRVDDQRSYFDALLPISIDQLPEKVQLVHMCTV